MDFSGLKLVSSNEDKLKEFRRLGLQGLSIVKGKDLREVQSDPITVVLYKALEAGPNRIVEDTSFDVEGADFGVNIKSRLGDLGKYIGRKARFTVYLAVHRKGNIEIYRGSQPGVITHPVMFGPKEKVFGFDNHFTPSGAKLNLHQLEKAGMKDMYSARRQVVEKLLTGDPMLVQRVSEIRPWDGPYQQH